MFCLAPRAAALNTTLSSKVLGKSFNYSLYAHKLHHNHALRQTFHHASIEAFMRGSHHQRSWKSSLRFIHHTGYRTSDSSLGRKDSAALYSCSL
jgi:hypothetical protein